MLRLLGNFDALFNTVNFLTAMLCLAASFRMDERAAVVLLVWLPVYICIVLGEATMSDNDFLKWWQGGYVFAVLLVGSGACGSGRGGLRG